MKTPKPRLEKAIQVEVMKALSEQPGVVIFKNNVGIAEFPDGSRVRYGLHPGSADLIGWRTVLVTPDMVGERLAVFLAVECKRPGTKPTKEQDNFLASVRHAGGEARVARDVADVAL